METNENYTNHIQLKISELNNSSEKCLLAEVKLTNLLKEFRNKYSFELSESGFNLEKRIEKELNNNLKSITKTIQNNTKQIEYFKNKL